MKIIFIIDLSAFGSNMFFDYDNYGFWKCGLDKTIHIYMIKGLNA
jgi:hypothetical protein